MNIQWFPGHMTKALRMMEENVKLVDCFIYVLDSRAVMASINPSFNKIIGDKPILYVLNKSDLININDLKKIESYFKAKKMPCVVSNSKESVTGKNIISKIKEINAEKIARTKAKNINKNIRAMVIGIPNTGKSTLINNLCGTKKTITADRPGVTKGKQWVNINNEIDLMDTPGTLCPSIENPEYALHIAFIGSINDDILDLQNLATELLKFIRINYLSNIYERYNVECKDKSIEEIIDEIAKKRGFIVKGGEIDYERTYNAIIDDYRKNKLGKIAFEIPKIE